MPQPDTVTFYTPEEIGLRSYAGVADTRSTLGQIYMQWNAEVRRSIEEYDRRLHWIERYSVAQDKIAVRKAAEWGEDVAA